MAPRKGPRDAKPLTPHTSKERHGHNTAQNLNLKNLNFSLNENPPPSMNCNGCKSTGQDKHDHGDVNRC